MSLSSLLLAYQAPPEFNFDPPGGGGGAAGIFGGIMGMLCPCVALILVIVQLIGMWKLFEKAGKPGWAAIVPIYNAIVLLEIVGRPIWFIVLLLCVGPVFHIIVSLDLAKSYGKDMVYGILMILFPYIFYPLLGFSDAKYEGPKQAF